ncbi:hypothetical protein EC957_006304 [Mortierella hygrophila]|uniref:FAD-binding domain-containing protein n=1 Tax=Mortierella hygrophila TaxID=979708 RepID=A0A9P6FED0_9FUNG|nr:hypothetical protein EC957_006304 [Mortierella hygrophila]
MPMDDQEFAFHLADAEHPISGRRDVPHVLISGGGLGGLILALLLEKAGISYLILERAKEVKPLGSVMSLSAGVLGIFEQLHLLEGLMGVSKPINDFKFFSDDLKSIGHLKNREEKDQTGYERLVFSRPELYDLLLAKIPAEKIHLSKKVVAMIQDEDAVAVRCQDKSVYVADILVGADGAYSGVRQSLYSRLDKEKLLPEGDKRSLNKGYFCLVGTTDRLDPVKFPQLREVYSDSSCIISDTSPHSWCTFSVPNDRVCWSLVIQLTAKESEEEQFRNSEWGPEANEPMIKSVAHFKTPYGTLGELINATPKDIVSRVFLEDMLYQTWHHDRTVLIGDACHKLLPSTGQGCVNAIQDATILANCLYDMKTTSIEDVKAAFEDYQEQRFDHVKTQYEASQWNAKVIYGHSFLERMLRQGTLNLLPKSVYRSLSVKDAKYRPQVTFLPRVPDRGTLPAFPQKPSSKYTEEQQAVPV